MKPADRLADIREQIRMLEAEEAALRAGFIAGDLSLEGDDHAVIVERKTTERIDARAMREHVDASIWKPFLIESTVVYIKTKRRERDDLKSSPRMHT